MHLWDYHKEVVIEDLLQDHPYNAAINIALYEIDSILKEIGISCATLGPFTAGKPFAHTSISHQF